MYRIDFVRPSIPFHLSLFSLKEHVYLDQSIEVSHDHLLEWLFEYHYNI